jgi:large subunit ribosomal protein L4
MEAITLPVYNIEGKEVDTVKLDTSVFDGSVNLAAIYQAVNAFRANQRKGLAATKTRGEVSGGGKKPWKQKGTGRARVGSTRSPLWRHGGVVFGPHPRDFSYKLSPKVRNLALRSGLNSKIKENSLLVLEALSAQTPKTKDMVNVFSNLKIDLKKTKANDILFITDKIDKNLKLATRNIGFLATGLSKQANVYEVLNCRKLVITKDGLAELTKRLKQ